MKIVVFVEWSESKIISYHPYVIQTSDISLKNADIDIIACKISRVA